jgi:plasmid stability protein
MATLTIRDLSEEAYDRLKARADRNRRSATQEAAWILERALAEPVTTGEAWAEVDRVRELVRHRYGIFPDSAADVRQDRER